MRAYLRQCGSCFLYAGLFSLFINLLLLTTPLYSMQVFDRVLTSRSTETLLVLTLLLDMFQIHYSTWLDPLFRTLFL